MTTKQNGHHALKAFRPTLTDEQYAICSWVIDSYANDYDYCHCYHSAATILILGTRNKNNAWTKTMTVFKDLTIGYTPKDGGYKFIETDISDPNFIEKIQKQLENKA